MPKKQAISVTLDPEVISYLDRLARKDRRSKSAMVEIILAEHAEKNGKQLTLSPDQVPVALGGRTEG